MDFEMVDYLDHETQDKVWDFKVKDGVLHVVDHYKSEEQRAIIASYIQRGTIPQLQAFGVQWAELLTSQVSPQQINVQIRESISSVVDGLKFVPEYKMENGKLLVDIKAVNNG